VAGYAFGFNPPHALIRVTRYKVSGASLPRFGGVGVVA